MFLPHGERHYPHKVIYKKMKYGIILGSGGRNDNRRSEERDRGV